MTKIVVVPGSRCLALALLALTLSAGKSGHVVLRDSNNRYLLLRDVSRVGHGRWTYPGGLRDPDDDTNDGFDGRLNAAKREFREESGIPFPQAELLLEDPVLMTNRGGAAVFLAHIKIPIEDLSGLNRGSSDMKFYALTSKSHSPVESIIGGKITRHLRINEADRWIAVTMDELRDYGMKLRSCVYQELEKAERRWKRRGRQRRGGQRKREVDRHADPQ